MPRAGTASDGAVCGRPHVLRCRAAQGLLIRSALAYDSPIARRLLYHGQLTAVSQRAPAADVCFQSALAMAGRMRALVVP